jgi:hypothetical protein
MALEISYWTGRAKRGTQALGSLISSETRSTSGTSAQSGATPSGAGIVRVKCTTAADRVAYGSNPTASATFGEYLAVGDSTDFEATPGFKVAGITA